MNSANHSRARSYHSTAGAGESVFVEHSIGRLPAGRILNVGAGRARAAPSGRSIVDVDIDPLVLVPTSNDVAADAQRLPFLDGSFDGALLKDVLEHVPDPIAALREVRRVCNADARVIITVPRAIPRAVWADPTHLRGFTSSSLVMAMELGGWTVDDRICRMGSIPGAGHWPFLLRHANQILRVPGIGHRLGTNWLAVGRVADE